MDRLQETPAFPDSSKKVKGKRVHGVSKPCPPLPSPCHGRTARGLERRVAAPHRPLPFPDSAFLLSWVSLSKEKVSLEAAFCPFSPLTNLCRLFLSNLPSQFSLRVQWDHRPPPLGTAQTCTVQACEAREENIF